MCAHTPSGGDLAPNLGGTEIFFAAHEILNDIFSGKISIFRVKISDRPGFSDFPFHFPDFPYLYYVKCRICPFPHKKNTFFYSVHTFMRIRQHYFSKFWGGPMHGPSPTSNFGGTVPPRSPPLHTPVVRRVHTRKLGAHIDIPSKTFMPIFHTCHSKFR